MTVLTPTERKRIERERRRSQRVSVDGRFVHPSAPHGTRNGYTNWACRCLKCTDSWNDAMRARRHERYASRVVDASGWWVQTAPVTHGKASTYHNWGCQCEPCRRAAALARHPGARPRAVAS